MPLPKLEVPQYNLTLFSTKEDIVYRPFLVKEEKILLMALEGEDSDNILAAIRQIIENCIIQGNVNISELPLFDLENLFLNIRAKSVGETSTISVPCTSETCEASTPHDINLEEIKIVQNDDHQTSIGITDTIGVNMKYPSVNLITELETLDENDIEQSLDVMTSCIDSVYEGEEEHDFRDYTKEERNEFLNQLTQQQLIRIQDFFNTMPTLECELEFKCTTCGTEDLIPLRGLQNFFS